MENARTLAEPSNVKTARRKINRLVIRVHSSRTHGAAPDVGVGAVCMPHVGIAMRAAALDHVVVSKQPSNA